MLARSDDIAKVEAARDELLDLLYEVLGAYAAGDADLSALVHDVDSVIIELTLLSDPVWIENMRNQWTALARALLAHTRAGSWVPTEPERDRIAAATQGLLFLADVCPAVARPSAA